MSTTYITMQPMTLEQAVQRLKEFGCTVDRKNDDYAVVKDPDGNYFHLTDDIASYRTLSFDLSAGTITVSPTEIQDGTTRVMGECYNTNDATRMAEVLGMVSEFEDEYHDIMDACRSCDEDELDDPDTEAVSSAATVNDRPNPSEAWPAKNRQPERLSPALIKIFAGDGLYQFDPNTLILVMDKGLDFEAFASERSDVSGKPAVFFFTADLVLRLSPAELRRMVFLSLRKKEFFALLERYGMDFWWHGDFYDHTTGRALQPR